MICSRRRPRRACTAKGVEVTAAGACSGTSRGRVFTEAYGTARNIHFGQDMRNIWTRKNGGMANNIGSPKPMFLS